MAYYPIFLRVADRPVVVIGGGAIAERKVQSLLSAGAQVTVLSPAVSDGLARLAAAGSIRHEARGYHAGDLRGAVAAFAATNDDRVHRAVAAEADAAGIPLNVVDQPDLCSFIVPAVVTRGDLTIAVSTNGASPALAKRIRGELEEHFGDEYARVLAILRAVRRVLQASDRSAEQRQAILSTLANSSLLALVRRGDAPGIDALLQDMVGTQTSMAALGLAGD